MSDSSKIQALGKIQILSEMREEYAKTYLLSNKKDGHVLQISNGALRGSMPKSDIGAETNAAKYVSNYPMNSSKNREELPISGLTLKAAPQCNEWY